MDKPCYREVPHGAHDWPAEGEPRGTTVRCPGWPVAEMPCARMDAHGAHRWTPGDGTEPAQCPGIGSHPELLTRDEHEAVELAGRVATLLDRIVPDGPTRAGDLAELCGHVHVLQNAVLAQAAARAYPGRYRLMGATVVQGGAEFFRADGVTLAVPTDPAGYLVAGSLVVGPDGGVKQSGDLRAWRCPDPMPHDPHPWGGLSCLGRDEPAPCRVCDGKGNTHRLGCPEADRTDPLPRDVTFGKPGLTGDSHGDLERLAAWSGLAERRCQLATAHDEHGWRPVPGAHTVFRCPGLPGGEASFPAGTEVTVDGSALTAPASLADNLPAERCRDPWTPDAHEPHNWRPADDPQWRYCDGLQLVHDGLVVRRCRNGAEHRAHRWGTRLADPPVPAGLASDAPGLAWCPGLRLELKGVRTVREGELTKWGDPDWRSVCERASAVAVGAGAPDDGATLPEQVEWLAAELHGPSLRPPADRPVLLPFVIEAEPGSTGEGVARTLRALRWDCFDRVQLDRRAAELLLEALADRELAEGDVRYFPTERIHYTVVVDTEGAPHLRPAKIGEIPEVPS